VTFIREFNEKTNGLTDSSFISDILIMDDFNYSISERDMYTNPAYSMFGKL
jgi:hypothetical protein